MAGMAVGALGLGAAPPLLAAARGRHLRRSVAGRGAAPGAVVCRARAATGNGDRVSRVPAAAAAGSSGERDQTGRLGGGAASGTRRTVRCQGLFDNFKNPFASKDVDEAEPHITIFAARQIPVPSRVGIVRFSRSPLVPLRYSWDTWYTWLASSALRSAS